MSLSVCCEEDTSGHVRLLEVAEAADQGHAGKLMLLEPHHDATTTRIQQRKRS
jgi:hypothetical protein